MTQNKLRRQYKKKVTCKKSLPAKQHEFGVIFCRLINSNMKVIKSSVQAYD